MSDIFKQFPENCPKCSGFIAIRDVHDCVVTDSIGALVYKAHAVYCVNCGWQGYVGK